MQHKNCVEHIKISAQTYKKLQSYTVHKTAQQQAHEKI